MFFTSKNTSTSNDDVPRGAAISFANSRGNGESLTYFSWSGAYRRIGALFTCASLRCTYRVATRFDRPHRARTEPSTGSERARRDCEAAVVVAVATATTRTTATSQGRSRRTSGVRIVHMLVDQARPYLRHKGGTFDTFTAHRRQVPVWFYADLGLSGNLRCWDIAIFLNMKCIVNNSLHLSRRVKMSL